ncbi:MAG: DUF4271 domain-containing protein [Paludibacteraceae bacterium]|nr:DUF4271 domain-containing protein [Paludibacteraceae bacterium]
MPETDIVQTVSDSTVRQHPVAPQNVESLVLPPKENEVIEAVPYPTDTVVVWRPKRIEKVDTFYISAFDFPETVMDTTYLDSCLKEESVTAPECLLPPVHVPVSAEELAYDSIFAKLTSVSDTTFVSGGLVTSVSAKDQYVGFEGIPKVECLQNQFWFAPLLFAFFFCYGLVFALRSKSVVRDTKEFFSLNRYSSSSEYSNEQKTQYRFALNALAVANISVFVVLALHSYYPKLGPKSYLMAVAVCVALSAGYVIFKQLTSAYLAFVFFNSNVRREWSHAFLYLWGMLGMVLFPVNLCLSFGPVSVSQPLLYFGFGVACLTEFLIIVYDIARFFGHKFSILYLFLYLCTLEFLPLAALLFGYYNAIATV